MGMTLKLVAVVVGCSALLSVSACAQAVNQNESTNLTQARECEECVPLQFGELLMQIPLKDIEKIAVLGSELSALHLVPKDGVKTGLVTFLSLPHAEFVGKYERAKLLSKTPSLTNKELLDRLFANSGAKNDSYAVIRKIEGIGGAIKVHKATCNGLYLYRVRRDRPQIDQIYIVVQGSPITYTIAGEITDTLFHALWSNMRSVPLL